MNKKVELPIVESYYSTYHYGVSYSIIKENLSVKNHFMNQIMILTCSKKFLNGFTSPQLAIHRAGLFENPYVESILYLSDFLEGCTHKLIKNLINNGYYVYLSGLDDFYIEGKSWYNERHFKHDATICGYDDINKSYCMYAYDSNWIYKKFWTPRSGFEKAISCAHKKNERVRIIGIRVKKNTVSFSSEIAIKYISEYLNSNMKLYPFKDEQSAYGIVVHYYLAKYIDKLYDGSIPYEKMDWRIFRLVWEHKTAMYERITLIEKDLKIGNKISNKYKSIVNEANTIRMLYASHHMRRRDSILPIIRKKLLWIYTAERRILNSLVKTAEKEFDKNALELPQK